MIPLSIAEIAAVVGGTIEGDATVTVTAPAVLDGLQAEPGGLFAPSPASTPRPRCRPSPPTSWPGCATG
jgi:hypothetical protein